MGRRWQGGIHNHPNGFWAHVPKKRGGVGHRKFHGSLEVALEWQDAKGREEWGSQWPSIKEHGPKKRLLTHQKRATKSQQIEPGLCVRVRKSPARTNPEHQVVITYMEMNGDQKRQRSRAFTFDSPSSGRTKEQAIKEARRVLYEKRRNYANYNPKG